MRNWPPIRGRRQKNRAERQKREVLLGTETAELEGGWTPFAWKHNALRHSFTSYRMAQVQDVAKVPRRLSAQRFSVFAI